MKVTVKKCANRAIRLPTVMLMLALFAGVASVGQAQDIPEMVITTKRPVAQDASAELRDEMQTTADSVVRKTRFRVAVDLGVKLGFHQDRIRLAEDYDRKRG